MSQPRMQWNAQGKGRILATNVVKTQGTGSVALCNFPGEFLPTVPIEEIVHDLQCRKQRHQSLAERLQKRKERRCLYHAPGHSPPRPLQSCGLTCRQARRRLGTSQFNASARNAKPTEV